MDKGSFSDFLKKHYRLLIAYSVFVVLLAISMFHILGKTGIDLCQESSLNARAFFVDGIEQRIRHILDALDYTIVQAKRLDDGI